MCFTNLRTCLVRCFLEPPQTICIQVLESAKENGTEQLYTDTSLTIQETRKMGDFNLSLKTNIQFNKTQTADLFDPINCLCFERLDLILL